MFSIHLSTVHHHRPQPGAGGEGAGEVGGLVQGGEEAAAAVDPQQPDRGLLVCSDRLPPRRARRRKNLSRGGRKNE